MGNDRAQGHGIEAQPGRSTSAGNRRVAVDQPGASYGFPWRSRSAPVVFTPKAGPVGVLVLWDDYTCERRIIP